MYRPTLTLGLVALMLAGCQTSPKQTVLNLDTTDRAWSSRKCMAARKAVHEYDDHEGVRAAAGLAGTVAAGPVVGVATTLSLSALQDGRREELNAQVKAACVSKAKSQARR